MDNMDNDELILTGRIDVPVGHNSFMEVEIPLPQTFEEAQELREYLDDFGIEMEDVIGDWIMEHAEILIDTTVEPFTRDIYREFDLLDTPVDDYLASEYFFDEMAKEVEEVLNEDIAESIEDFYGYMHGTVKYMHHPVLMDKETGETWLADPYWAYVHENMEEALAREAKEHRDQVNKMTTELEKIMLEMDCDLNKIIQSLGSDDSRVSNWDHHVVIGNKSRGYCHKGPISNIPESLTSEHLSVSAIGVDYVLDDEQKCIEITERNLPVIITVS
jgi:hypothetical protein